MKIYARQMDPEYQMSPLFIDELFPDDIAVCGNRYYNEHCSEVFKNVRSVLDVCELAELLTDTDKLKNWYKNATEAIVDYLPPQKVKYSTRDIGALKSLILLYADCPYSEKNAILCNVLSIVTGQEWKHKLIRGCCQSEWNYVYYPVANWSYEALAAFEIEYFNTGTEWIVDDGEFNPENSSPLDISGYSIYCLTWDDEEIRKEIASAEGCSPSDVVLYAFDGYYQMPKYKAV